MKVLSEERNRAASEPGGCECMTCGAIFVGAEWHTECGVCWDRKNKCANCGQDRYSHPVSPELQCAKFREPTP